MSTNSWAPSDEAGDPLIDRLEQMIAPSFDDADLPRPADPSAELPWLSGSPSAAIAPDFDTEGLPQVAGSTPPAPLVPPPVAPAAAPGGFAPPPPPPSAVSAPPFSAAPAPLSSPPAPGSLAGPAMAPPTGGLTAPAPLPTPLGAPAAVGQVAAAPPPPPPSTAAAPSVWGSPDPAGAVPLPSPDQVREAREKAMAMQQRPRTPLLIGLAASVVALVAMGVVVLRGGEAPEAPPVAVLAPDTTDGAPAETPLVLPSFTPVTPEWESITIRYEVASGEGRRTVDLVGPADRGIVSVVDSLVPSDPAQDLVTEELILTPDATFVSTGDGWSRDRDADDSRFTTMAQRLAPRSFEDVIPVEARPLVDVVSIEDLDETGLRRYTIDLRTATFATQYPALFETWAAVNLWSSPVGERATVTVDVDETGLVQSTTIEATSGSITLSSDLSDQPSSVTVPRR